MSFVSYVTSIACGLKVASGQGLTELRCALVRVAVRTQAGDSAAGIEEDGVGLAVAAHRRARGGRGRYHRSREEGPTLVLS